MLVFLAKICFKAVQWAKKSRSLVWGGIIQSFQGPNKTKSQIWKDKFLFVIWDVHIPWFWDTTKHHCFSSSVNQIRIYTSALIPRSLVQTELYPWLSCLSSLQTKTGISTIKSLSCFPGEPWPINLHRLKGISCFLPIVE